MCKTWLNYFPWQECKILVPPKWQWYPLVRSPPAFQGVKKHSRSKTKPNQTVFKHMLIRVLGGSGLSFVVFWKSLAPIYLFLCQIFAADESICLWACHIIQIWWRGHQSRLWWTEKGVWISLVKFKYMRFFLIQRSDVVLDTSPTINRIGKFQ